MQIENSTNETISNVIWHANFTDQFLLCSWEKGVFIPLLFLSFDYKYHEKADSGFYCLSSVGDCFGSCLSKDDLSTAGCS